MIDQESTYQTRYETRVKSIQDKEKFVTSNLSKNKIGNMTAELLVKNDQTMTDAGIGAATDVKPMEYETITTPGTQVGPQVTEEKTEKFPIAFSTGTYSFDEVFPESKTLDLEFNDVRQLNNDAEKSFQKNIILKRGGVERIPAGSKYLIGFKESGKTDKTQYAMDIYKKEYIADILGQYNKTVNETQVSSKFAIPEGTKVSDIVIQAREKISEIQGNPSIDEDQKDIYIDQIKTVVNEQLSAMDIEPSKFGF